MINYHFNHRPVFYDPSMGMPPVSSRGQCGPSHERTETESIFDRCQILQRQIANIGHPRTSSTRHPQCEGTVEFGSYIGM